MLIGARDPERDEKAAAEAGGSMLALDVTDAVSVAGAAARVPTLDVLVDNAGISLDTPDVITDVDLGGEPPEARPDTALPRTVGARERSVVR